MGDVKIIVTEDGSHSLYDIDLKETYHSFHGALNESRHVFIEKGLRHWRNKEGLPDSMSIFEVGFGTGLNALLALQFAEDHKIKVNYHTLEPHPLNNEVVEQLNYANSLADGAFKKKFLAIHDCAWEQTESISQHFNIYKSATTLQEVNGKLDHHFDVIFFDAFAPNKQAEMWALELIRKTYHLLKEGGVFVTYSAKGQLKRDLKAVGYTLETLAGPPGKKEMVRATKNLMN